MINSVQLDGSVSTQPIFKSANQKTTLEFELTQVQDKFTRKFIVAATGKTAEYSQRLQKGQKVLVLGWLANITKNQNTFVGVQANRIYVTNNHDQVLPEDSVEESGFDR